MGAFVSFSLHDGEQLSLAPPQEPGEQRQDLMLLREHLFPIEPLLGWALSYTCSRAPGLFFWAAVSRSPLLSALSSVLSPLSLATGHGLGPGWPSQLGWSDSEGVVERYWPLDILKLSRAS